MLSGVAHSAAYYPYLIANSLIFNDDDSAYLSHTFAAGDSDKVLTFSTWFKRGNLTESDTYFLSAGASAIDGILIDSTEAVQISFAGGGTYILTTDAVFRDIASWYHLVINIDTTQATASDRVKIYINGVLQAVTGTYPALNYTFTKFNTAIAHELGKQTSGTAYYDGYLAETILVDGAALTPASFGVTNADGIWVPLPYTGSYGTNGFRLDYENSGDLGNDVSGNDNDFTPSGLTASDQTEDTPTDNYCVLNALRNFPSSGTFTLSEGNLRIVDAATTYGHIPGTMGMSSGKWYWEVTCVSSGGNVGDVGLIDINSSSINYVGGQVEGYAYNTSGDKKNNSSAVAYGAAYTTADVIGVAFDADAGTLEFFKNNVSQGDAYTSIPSGTYTPAVGDEQNATQYEWLCDFGQNGFTYAPPAGYKALRSKNLPDSTIMKGSDYSNTVLYTGNASVRSITGINFSPGLTWIKNRDAADEHKLIDTVRGATKELSSDSTSIESTDADGLTSFDSDGFSLGTGANGYNDTGEDFVAWNWLESVLAGFDIVDYVGNGSNRTIAHALGAIPELIIIKNRDSATDWPVYHKDLTATTKYLLLDTNAAEGTDATMWNSTAPTSSVFSVGAHNATNENTKNIIAYLFAGIEGYSKFGNYIGNGDADGPFVYCGFRPAFILIKGISTTTHWLMIDGKRPGYNVTPNGLFSNQAIAEETNRDTDILSNGFKPRVTALDPNTSGVTYIYMAFAENPFKYANAR